MRLLTVAAAVGGTTLIASAQEAAPTGIVAATDVPQATQTPAPQTQVTPPPAAARRTRAVDTLSKERVGVDPGRKLKLGLQEAILMALRNNQDIEVERTNVQIAQENAKGAYGAYDPTLQVQFQFQNSTTATAQTFIGAADGAFKRKQIDVNPTFSQTLNTGGNYSIAFTNSRTTNNAGSAGLNPQYGTSLTFNFSQPLLRNYRSSINERLVKVNKKQLTISDAVFRQRVIATIANVQQAYWDLVYAIQNNQIQRDAVELADVSLAITQRQVEVGTVAPIEVVSTQSELENRKDTAISALQAVTTAENQLKRLILGDPNSDVWQADVEPTEGIDFTPANFDLQDALKSATRNRPELEQNHLQQEINQIDQSFSRNQLKPQLDAFFNYSLQGLGGQGPTNCGGENQPPCPPAILVGGYGTSLKNLFATKFPTYTTGVTFSFNFRNRSAKAALGRAVATERQLKAQDRTIQQTIQVEVRNALQSVTSARQRVEATRAARVAAETQLRGEEQRYAAGLSTTFLVLDRQNRLSLARGNEIRALTDYNKAISDVQRVMGTSLAANGVKITETETAPQTTTP